MTDRPAHDLAADVREGLMYYSGEAEALEIHPSDPCLTSLDALVAQVDSLREMCAAHTQNEMQLVARVDTLARERDALREAARIADNLNLDLQEPYAQEMERRQALEAALAAERGKGPLTSREREFQTRADKSEGALADTEDHYAPFVTIVAALAIYGEGANLPALVEKARELNEANVARRALAGDTDGLRAEGKP